MVQEAVVTEALLFRYFAGVYILQNTMAGGGGKKNGAGEKNTNTNSQGT